jgi:hypothetical protein
LPMVNHCAEPARNNARHAFHQAPARCRLPFCLPPPLLCADAANQTQLRLVIVDQTGAGIPAATVTVKPATGEPVEFTADDHGVAASPNLVPGAVTGPRRVPRLHAVRRAADAEAGRDEPDR